LVDGLRVRALVHEPIERRADARELRLERGDGLGPVDEDPRDALLDADLEAVEGVAERFGGIAHLAARLRARLSVQGQAGLFGEAEIDREEVRHRTELLLEPLAVAVADHPRRVEAV